MSFQYIQIDNKIIRTPVMEILKIIKRNLHNGKLTVIKDMGDNIRVTCPFHKDGKEDKPSADIYIGTETDKLHYGWFNCFSCNMSCPFYHFVAGCFDCDDNEAKRWLINNFGEDLNSENLIQLDDLNLDDIKEDKRKAPINENILKTFENFHPYMIKRKLSKRIIDVFEVKYDPKTQCIVFPVRDINNKLVMLTRRSVIDKTFIIDKNKEKPVYLLNYMKSHDIDTFMITESQIDALTACSYGFPCVATMGKISDKQIDILNKANIKTLYMMFDNDEAGESFAKKLSKGLRKDILLVNVKILFKDKKDINDLSYDEFYYCLDKADESF